MPRTPSKPQRTTYPASQGEEGFLLLGAIVMIALVLIALAIAAPIVARDLRRDKDLEAVHRGNQYVRAIQLYYRKFGRYPGSLDQLEHTNNIRFLRKRYADPINGQDDFTIIPVGQNKTTVKTFFGQPVTGLPGSGPGGAAAPGIAGASAIGTPAGATSFGPTGTTATAGATGATAPGAAAGAPGATAGATGVAAGAPGTPVGAPGTAGAAGAAGPPSSNSTFGNSASSFGSSGSLGAPFMGVTLGAKGSSIIELNEQTDYGAWEFLYDPRLDQLKARAAALNGGGPGSVPGSSLGQPGIPTGLTGAPASTPGGITPPASTPQGNPPATQP